MHCFTKKMMSVWLNNSKHIYLRIIVNMESLIREIFWEKYIKGKSINGPPMHAERAHYGVFRKKCFILYVHILHVKSLVSIDTYVWTLKTVPGYYHYNDGTLKILLTCNPVYRENLWHDRTNVRNIPWCESIHS